MKGWTKIGLSDIIKPERQAQALLNLAKNGQTIDDAPDSEVELDPISAADDWDGQAEEEECDEKSAVEEDEEEIDMDVSIAACLEDRVIVQGVRRSSRLANRGDVARDRRIAELMQDSVYHDGCVLHDDE